MRPVFALTTILCCLGTAVSAQETCSIPQQLSAAQLKSVAAAVKSKTKAVDARWIEPNTVDVFVPASGMEPAVAIAYSCLALNEKKVHSAIIRIFDAADAKKQDANPRSVTFCKAPSGAVTSTSNASAQGANTSNPRDRAVSEIRSMSGVLETRWNSAETLWVAMRPDGANYDMTARLFCTRAKSVGASGFTIRIVNARDLQSDKLSFMGRAYCD